MAKDFDSNWATYTHPEVEEAIKDKVAKLEERIDENALPEGGIPKSELSSDVQASLDKADSAYQKPASGIPATDIAGGVIPNVSGLATKSEVITGLAGKVDKNGTDSLMTAAEHTKLDGIADGAQVNVINSISVNNTPVTPVNGNVNISVEEGGSVESVTVNGTKYTPDINGDVNLGDLRGQDGNSGVASADGVESVNNLNGGTTDTQSKVYVLGANQGKKLKDKIDYVYGRLQAVYAALGNIAFWDGKTNINTILPDIYWGNPMHTLTIVGITNAAVTMNGSTVPSQIEEGSTVTLVIAPDNGYAFGSAPTATLGSSSQTVTDNGDGTYSVEFAMPSSDVTLTFSGSVSAAYSITVNGTNCQKVSGQSAIISGGTATIVIEAASGYVMPSTQPVGLINGASATYTRDSSDDTKATIAISSPTDAVIITIAAVQAFTGTINVKKITACPSIDNSGNVTPVQGGESDYDMTIVDDNTIACSVDGSWKINIPSGYGLFSAVLKSNGTDVSDKIDFSTLVIDSTSLTGTLTLDLVVAEATDGMFLGKSFHHSEGATTTAPGNFITGGVPVNTSSPNDDWCCMSEFVKVPTGVTNIKFEFGSILSSSTSTFVGVGNKASAFILYLIGAGTG